jgi:phage-related protein
LYEVRSDLGQKTISRVIFTIYKNEMVLLHGFIKKDQKIPRKEMDIARNRLKKFSQRREGKNEP